MIPHIEQKHNTNQLTLQHIGNLPYYKGKTATSYDSVNSLTTHNNHYTLLYPDLVQELFDLALHKNNIRTNISHFLCDSDKNINKSSIADASLSPRDILFFLQIVSLYQLELSKDNSSITYPSLKLAKLLGIDASCDNANVLTDANMRATILRMTSKLEALGLLKVFRKKRSNGMDMANKLIPVLPDRLHARIKDLPANLKVSDSSKLDHESNLEHILRTKLFVPIELEFMKSLFKNNLPSKYKLFFLNCIMSAYRNFRHNSSVSFKQDLSSSDSRAEEDINSSFYDSHGNLIDLTHKLSFSATSRELMKKNDISRSTLDRIFRYIKQQGDSFFLRVEHKYTKSDDIDCNRYDKSIFVISINPLVFPISQIRKSQTEEITEFNHEELQGNDFPIFPDTYEEFKTAWSKKQPSIIKKTALNNKDIIIKNKYSRNIDYIDVNCEDLENPSKPFSDIPLPSEKNYKEEFFEDKQSLSSSEFYNNSPFFNNACKQALLRQKVTQKDTEVKLTNKEVQRKEQSRVQQKEQKEKLQNKPKAEWKELRHFYPLSDGDISTLNFRANREFSNNFVNQLLLKLYIKYPEKRFKNKFTFLSYMQKILANEKHQGPLVNHTTFRFSCNIGTEEKSLLEYEKYLSAIENSCDISKETQVKKKIAGRFSAKVAYEILTGVEFKTNYDNSFITALIPSQLDLSDIQVEHLKERLEAVYGKNKYYVEIVEDLAKETEKQEKRRNLGQEKQTNTKEQGAIQTVSKIPQGVSISSIATHTVWYALRKGLIEELGEAIDAAWFSKADTTEDKETGTLTLTMPTRFMLDWVKNRYGYAISRISCALGVKYIEYNHL